MIILFFGSPDCRKCAQAYPVISGLDCVSPKDLIYVDSSTDETQDLCDEYDVEALPHVVVINDEWKVAYEIKALKSLPDLVAFLEKMA